MPGDLATGIGKAVGAAAGGAVTGGVSSIADVFASLFKLWATPGGQDVIHELLPHPERIKAAQDKLDAAVLAERPIGPADTR